MVKKLKLNATNVCGDQMQDSELNILKNGILCSVLE